MSALQQTALEMHDQMLRMALFVVLTTPIASESDLAKMLPEHLSYMLELEKSGVLFGSGPFVGGSDVPAGSGMTILRASSSAEAASIAERDPFNRRGLRRFEVREWQLNEGRFTVTVDYSDGRYTIA